MRLANLPSAHRQALSITTLLLLSFCCAALLALLAEWTRPWERAWAVDFWRYAPLAVRALLAGLFGIVFVWTVHPLSPSLLRTVQRLPGWLPIPLLGLTFWLLRERTHAGDALLKLISLEEKSLHTDPYVWKEPLDAFVAYTVYDLLRPLGFSSADTPALLSVLAGMVYVAAILWIARLLLPTTEKRLLLVVGLLALGSSQLWFGHVESYSWVTAFTYLGVAVALAHLHGRAPLWAVGLVCGTAVSFHPQAAFALPALLVLLERKHWLRQAVVLAAACAFMPLLITATLLLMGVPLPHPIGYAGDVQLFWTPAQALAPAQLWDALMNLWLLVPGLPLLLPLAVWGWTQPQARCDRRFRYLSAVAGGLLLFFFGFQNDLPRPQDWDLYASVGPSVALLGYWVGLTYWTPDLMPMRRTLTAACLAFSLTFTAAWIGVNHAYTLVRVDPAYSVLYERYRLLPLVEALPDANVQPAAPVCDDPALDAVTGCRRVTASSFNIPPVGDYYRPVIFSHAPARIAFALHLPPEPTFLWLSPALDPLAWGWGGDGITFRVLVQRGRQYDLLLHRHIAPHNPQDLAWQDIYLPLAAYSGQSVHLILETLPGPDGDATADRGGWGMAWLMRGTVRE